MLLEIRAYVEERGSASLSDIALHFRRDPDAVRGMLAHWVGKGVMRCSDAMPACAGSTGCGGACACDPSAFMMYEWAGSARARTDPCRPQI